MKAILIAVVLLFVVPQQACADIKSSPPLALPATTEASKKINLNSATVQMLTNSFKGIGKKRAEAIVNYREEHRGFHSLAELANVKGIGQTFVEKHYAQLNEVYFVE